MEMFSLDKHDRELLTSLAELGPLMQKAARYTRDDGEERQQKRPKQEEEDEEMPEGRQGRSMRGQADQPQQVLGLLRNMARILLQHEKSLQLLHKQESFVMFIQVDPQGALPLLATLAGEWKRLQSANPGSPTFSTLRTHLLRGLLKEMSNRLVQMSNSQQGMELWSGDPRSLAERRVLALSTMGSGEEADGSGPQSPGADAETSERVSADVGVAGGFIARGPVPLTPSTGPDGALVPPDNPAPRRPMEVSRRAGSVLHMGLDGHLHEDPQPGVEPPGEVAPTVLAATFTSETQRSGEGQEQEAPSPPIASRILQLRLRDAMLTLVFGNSGTLCFANSAVATFLWACLSRISFTTADWGTPSPLFQALLLEHDDQHLP
eukprot:s584_g16.t3